MASYELLPAFEAGFRRRVKAPWPPWPNDLEKRAREKIGAYFSAFQGFGAYEVLAVEQKLITEIAGRPFSGIPDLVLRNEEGRLCIVDHKSSGIQSYRGKQLERHKRQLYLYAHLYSQCFGFNIDDLAFNLFKEGRWIRFPNTRMDQEATLSWVASAMSHTESLLERYFQFLTPLEQRLQLALLSGKSIRQISNELGLSRRRCQMMLLDMDEAALAICGRKESPGGFGCRHICSARNCCEEGKDHV